MTLKETIVTTQKKAMKAGEKKKVTVLRNLHAAIKQAEIDTQKELTDTEVEQVVQREVKQLQDPIAEFASAGRDDLVKQHKDEIDILSEFLPEQLTDDELQAVIDTSIEQTGKDANFGQLMGIIMKEVSGKADGNRVRSLLEKTLS